MSSSRSGQWIPSPLPIRRQFARSAGVPCANRGNQATGTVIVLPSAKSTSRASSLTLTLSASASLSSVPEVLIPRPQQKDCVLHHQPLNPCDFRAAKAPASFQADRLQPKTSPSIPRARRGREEAPLGPPRKRRAGMGQTAGPSATVPVYMVTGRGAITPGLVFAPESRHRSVAHQQ